MKNQPTWHGNKTDTGIPEWWFVFRGQKMLLKQDESGASVPKLRALSEMGLSAVYQRAIGELHERPCFVACVEDDCSVPAGTDFHSLRTIFGMIEESSFSMAMRALSIVNWENTHRYCGRCGSPVLRREDILAQQCTDCDLMIFPPYFACGDRAGGTRGQSSSCPRKRIQRAALQCHRRFCRTGRIAGANSETRNPGRNRHRS